MSVVANPYAEAVNVNTPPVSVSDGTVYGVGSAPTGAWARYAGGVAIENSEVDAGWDLLECMPQRRLLLKKNGLFYFGSASTGWTAEPGITGTSALHQQGDSLNFLYYQYRSADAYFNNPPPFEPPAGTVQVVKAPGALAWTGHDNELAVSNGTGNGYTFYPPVKYNPILLVNTSELALLYWTGTTMRRIDLQIGDAPGYLTIEAGSLYEIESTLTVIVPVRKNFLIHNGLLLDGAIILDGRMAEV